MIQLMNQSNQHKINKTARNLEWNLSLMFICMLSTQEKLKNHLLTVVRLSQLNLNIITLAQETGKLFVEQVYLNSHILVQLRLSDRHSSALETTKIPICKIRVTTIRTVMKAWCKRGLKVVTQQVTLDQEASWLRSTKDHLRQEWLLIHNDLSITNR